MWRYEVLYYEDGIMKGKGFGYEDQFLRFLKKLGRKPNVQIIKTADNGRGIIKVY